MSDLDSVVTVSITRDAPAITRQGFGTPLIMSYHTRFGELSRTYSSLREMSDDGFTTYDDAYRMAAALSAQSPTVEQWVVGRLPVAPTFTTEVTITDATPGNVIKLVVYAPATGVATEINYTILAAATTTTVATAVELLIDAVAGVDSTSAGAVISATPTVAGRYVHISPIQGATVRDITADADYDTAINNLQAVNDEWYAVLIDSRSDANLDAVKLWVASQPKLFFADNTIPLTEAGSARTVELYEPNSVEFAASRYAARGLAYDPGSITWSLKTLTGATPYRLSTSQRTTQEGFNGNYYTTLAGRSVVRPGKLGDGEWIDIVHGIDALTVRIQEDVFNLLSSALKVPFTDSGFVMIENAILGAMRPFEGTVEQPGLLVTGTSKVTMPKASSISTVDKAARTLNNVRFSATLAGAVHTVAIDGYLSY